MTLRLFRRGIWAPAALLVIVAVACGGNGTAGGVAPQGPASEPDVPAPGPSPESPSQGADVPDRSAGGASPPAGSDLAPAEGPTAESAAPAPGEAREPAGDGDRAPSAGSGGRVGSDLADVLPTVSTMAASSAPPPTEPGDSADDLEGIEGVVAVPITSVDHVRHDVDYPTAPPAGGPHLGAWLNCGFYSVRVLDELAVHSLEHGAVWVTYRSDVPAAALEALAALAAGEPHLLVSPYDGQASPLVLSAWGRQLHLESLDDPRFERFLDVYMADGPTAPEPGAACWGAVGVPPEHPEAVPQQG